MLCVERRAEGRLVGQTGSPLDRPALRVGLAATPWQLQQSLNLLQRQGLSSPLIQSDQPGINAALNRVVALALSTSLDMSCMGALATIWLRHDGAEGLPADQWPISRRSLDQLRNMGKRLVEVEALAFDERTPSSVVLNPMMHVLKCIVVDMWDATDIVMCCPRSQAAHYCSKLGFSRVAGQGHDVAHANSILLRMPTLQMTPLQAESGAAALSA
ncbi:MAG: hypothetical protein JWM03_1102 [Rhodocyclales bacterium]|nr:hypothetical protein [Rhodocyclales bacterium]